MKQEDFLERVSSSLGPRPEAVARTAPPPVRGAGELADQLARELEAVGGFVHRARSPEEASSLLVRIASERGWRRLVRTALPALEGVGLDAALGAAGIEVVACDLAREGASREAIREQELSADAGLTAADYGIAESGTLALLAGPGRGRAVSLLPPVHLAVLRVEDVVYELGELFERVQARGDLPSALTFITGPSRTADIELVLTVGVHGPGELHLVLLE